MLENKAACVSDGSCARGGLGHGKNVGFGPGSHPGSVWPRASCLTSVCLTIIVATTKLLVRIK